MVRNDFFIGFIKFERLVCAKKLPRCDIYRCKKKPKKTTSGKTSPESAIRGAFAVLKSRL